MTQRPLPLLIGLMAIGFSLASLPAAGAPGDAPGCEPHPLFNRFPGEALGECERLRFNRLEMWRWIDPANPGAGEEPFSVEGEYWQYLNGFSDNAAGSRPTRLELTRNYENAVRQSKGTVLRASDREVVFRIRKDGDEYWGESGCGSDAEDGTCAAIRHRLVRVAGMEQVIVVTAEQIANSIADEGKAVFYGLFFDSGKAEMKPESAPTLEAMAAWLRANPQTRVFIVGHTDMQGSVEQNRSLSRARAAAVVKALVDQYAIDASRLEAEGAGPFAPVSNNTSDKGRAQNRRVEMVLR